MSCHEQYTGKTRLNLCYGLSDMKLWFVDDKSDNHETWANSFPEPIKASCELRSFFSVSELTDEFADGNLPATHIPSAKREFKASIPFLNRACLAVKRERETGYRCKMQKQLRTTVLQCFRNS